MKIYLAGPMTLDPKALEAAARTLPRVWPGGFEDQRQKDDGSGWALPPWTPNDFAREVAANVIEAYIAALTVEPEAPTHQHVKRGSTYTLIGFGKMQAEGWNETQDDGVSAGPSVDMEPVAIYRSTDDGSLWVRPREEFEDGRFIELPARVEPEAGEVK